ncbi:MAG TPA: HAMP domain-containing sensor histidine kinase [Saprospiraceae bacterium]|nr:HAMP domain-containing sensor histidine kinase [Saprospiraceae bacterium]
MRSPRLLRARFWISASMLLLSALLFLFLKKNYDDERRDLVKEASYVFSGVVRQMEGDVLYKFLGTLDTLPLDIRHIAGDSLRIEAHSTTAHRLPAPPKSLEKKIVQYRVEERHILAPEQTEMKGGISMLIKMDAVAGDSLHAGLSADGLLASLAARYDTAMLKADLRVQERVVRLQDSLPTWDALPVGLYADLASGEKFQAQLTGYQQYILKKMWPALLFSLLVLAVVALAFRSMWRSLNSQWQLVQVKNDLLQNIGHELKTPVATVSVAIEALRDFDVLAHPARAQDYLNISASELSRLSLLVDKVLNLAQLESQTLPMQRTHFDLKETVGKVLKAMTLQMEKAGATCIFDAPDAALTVHGDPLHLAGVVYNLLDNALKYSQAPPRIQVRLHRQGDAALLRVEDSGPGIPEQYRKQVFEKFFRIPTGNRHDVKGHGLGLHYAAEVLRLHGGDIRVEGSTFLVRLPMPPA